MCQYLFAIASNPPADRQALHRTDRRDHFWLLKLWLLVETIGRHLQTDIYAKVKFVTEES